VINGAGIARVYKVDADVRAGLDWRVNQFTPPVHDVTGPFENVSARIIRERLVDHERSGRLIIGGRACLTRRFYDCSRYRDCFIGSCSFFECWCVSTLSLTPERISRAPMTASA